MALRKVTVLTCCLFAAWLVTLIWVLASWRREKVMEMVTLKIKTDWQGVPFAHLPVTFTVERKPGDSKNFLIKVEAPFFDDPAPTGDVSKPLPKLWDYEVAEIFFLGKDEKYLEIELSPHGYYLVLVLKGKRNAVKDDFKIKYSSSIDHVAKTWTGAAEIPYEFLPPGVNKVNAYAIHGTGDKRTYEALYPADPSIHKQADFHRLEFFKDFDFKPMLPANWKPMSLYNDK